MNAAGGRPPWGNQEALAIVDMIQDRVVVQRLRLFQARLTDYQLRGSISGGATTESFTIVCKAILSYWWAHSGVRIRDPMTT